MITVLEVNGRRAGLKHRGGWPMAAALAGAGRRHSAANMIFFFFLNFLIFRLLHFTSA